MSMSRRKFLASLAVIPAGCVAAAKGLAAKPPPTLDLDEIIDMLYKVRSGREAGDYQLIVGKNGVILGMERVPTKCVMKIDVKTFKLRSKPYRAEDFYLGEHRIV